MYNRYIPQPDGTYRRSSIQDPPRQAEPRKQDAQSSVQQPPQRPQERKIPPKPCCNPCSNRPCPQPRKQPENPPAGIGTFLKQLLPRDFDTADLIIVLLLLLIASDGCDDGNTALLTLVLYLFL